MVNWMYVTDHINCVLKYSAASPVLGLPFSFAGFHVCAFVDYTMNICPSSHATVENDSIPAALASPSPFLLHTRPFCLFCANNITYMVISSISASGTQQVVGQLSFGNVSESTHGY